MLLSVREHSSVNSATSSELCHQKSGSGLMSLSSAFKYCCTARGEKLEKTDLRYACMAHVIRKGGIKVALITRLSAIPGHCEQYSPLSVVGNSNKATSFYRRLLDVRNECLDVHHLSIPLAS